MPSEEPNQISTVTLRQLAERKLAQLGKEPVAVKESYLFEKDRFIGVRFTHGPFCVLWNSSQDYASVFRGELLIETMNLVPGSEVRRAA